ncbi:MFS transporter [Burkholderia dolosa]|uniref:MFS transporter n=1 Tax=Burkholderia dolosa TaxID=152500 RepID=UPI00158FA40D|nr:MFS transporter [Burkholderia dolosa]MBR8458019.1 MFS transporter [Burkholderia dolosa]MBY4755081.1 MFS transporter [Burkholderia dolosa]MDN7422964.1 MFS transporter [Burkholderia dolosa]
MPTDSSDTLQYASIKGSTAFAQYKWRALIGVTFCYLFYYTGRQTLGFAVAGIQHDYGLSKYEIGWISATMLWCYAGGQFINGNLGDKLGGKTMMIAGAVLSLTANWLFSFGHTFLFFLLAWGFNGYFQSMGFAPGSRLLSNWWGHKHRGFVYGVYVGFSGFSSVLAYVFPVVILGTMQLGWVWIFRLAPLSMLLGALVLLLFVSERPEAQHLPAAEKSEEVAFPTESEDELTSVQRYALVMKNWRLYITGLAIGFQNAARYALVVWVPVHFLGMDWKTSSTLIDPKWITIALPVGMALGSLSNSWISDVLFQGRRYMAIVWYMVVACATAIFMMFVPHGSMLAIVLLFLCGFFVFGPASSFWALCPDIFGRRAAGTATGVLNAMSYMFAGIGEPVIGHIIDVTGHTSIIFPIVAGLCAASAVLSTLIKR